MKPRIVVPHAKRVSLKAAVAYWGLIIAAAVGGALWL